MTDPILNDVPMPIVTPRLLLRPAQPGDGPIVFEAVQESWDRLAPWSIWTFKPKNEITADDYEIFCRRKYGMFLKREDITLLSFERKTGRFIGGAGLHKCDWESRIFMLGFWVRTSVARQSYATEAATALIHYAFGALKANRVWSFHAAGNEGSHRVIERVGLKPEGILRGHHGLLNGKLTDEHVYGILDVSDAPKIDMKWR